MTAKTATGNKISNQRKINTRVVATLVYAIVNSRIDYCNAILAGAPRAVMDKLQRVLNAAARVVTGTWKFDRGLGQILHEIIIIIISSCLHMVRGRHIELALNRLYPLSCSE